MYETIERPQSSQAQLTDDWYGSAMQSRATPAPPPGYQSADSLVAPLDGLLYGPGDPTQIGQHFYVGGPFHHPPREEPPLPWWATVLMVFVGAVAGASGLAVVIASVAMLVYVAPWLS